MTAVATLQDRFSHDAYVSSESREVGSGIWRLLKVGWEMGIPTSMTETKASLWSDALAQRFQSLAKIWRDECAHLSSMREMVLHPAYQQIVGMGSSALPFIFTELERKPDHWFWALRAITQEDPVPPEHRGNVAEMVRAWLRWAERRGIRW
jgi:hypothetical protein